MATPGCAWWTARDRWSVPTAARGGLYKAWMVELCPGDDPVYVFMDSRNAVPRIAPMKARPRFHLIYLMHNAHTVKARRWNSPSIATYKTVLEHIKHLDAMVNLTERQSEDIAQKYGHTNNRFVVPNPIRPPARPVPMPPRDPYRLAIVARLEPQKGLADAVKAFALVREQVPEARLDLYGDGTQRQLIEDLVDELGLRDVLTMHGHDTLAQETLWTASGFFMPSVFEGYPLASLESMAHGCPVIAYDIKYGPREQIDDGVDGFLVAKGRHRGHGRARYPPAPRPGPGRPDERGRFRQGRPAQPRAVPARLEARHRGRGRPQAEPHGDQVGHAEGQAAQGTAIGPPYALVSLWPRGAVRRRHRADS